MSQPENQGHRLTEGLIAQASSAVVEPADMAVSMVTEALRASAARMGLDDTAALISCIRRGDCTALSYYNHSIARQLADVLGSLSKDIRAIYAHDYEGATPEEAAFEDTPPVPSVHMIIWAQRKTRALDALVETMDRAIGQHHRHVLGLIGLEPVLDVKVVDDQDVKTRTGYAALLKSIYQPPIQIWQSDPRGL